MTKRSMRIYAERPNDFHHRPVAWFRGLTLDEAMPQIWVGIQERKFVVICGFKAKLTYVLNRYLPESLMHAIIDGKVNKMLKRP